MTKFYPSHNSIIYLFNENKNTMCSYNLGSYYACNTEYYVNKYKGKFTHRKYFYCYDYYEIDVYESCTDVINTFKISDIFDTSIHGDFKMKGYNDIIFYYKENVLQIYKNNGNQKYYNSHKHHDKIMNIKILNNKIFIISHHTNDYAIKIYELTDYLELKYLNTFYQKCIKKFRIIDYDNYLFTSSIECGIQIYLYNLNKFNFECYDNLSDESKNKLFEIYKFLKYTLIIDLFYKIIEHF